MEVEIKNFTVAIVGNPNSGKSTVFNALTGLNQRTGNFPGVTVERHTGSFRYHDTRGGKKVNFKLIDLPGTYSIYPKSLDEEEAAKVLLKEPDKAEFDFVLVVADVSNLGRSLSLCTQVMDLGHQVLLVVNMMDLLNQSHQSLKLDKLSEALGIPVIGLSAKEKTGIRELKTAMANFKPSKPSVIFATDHGYLDWVKANTIVSPSSLDHQEKEAMMRSARINEIINGVIIPSDETQSFAFSRRIDAILTHRIWGFVVFIGLLALVFQAIFSWAEAPMDWIDQGFAALSEFVSEVLPDSAFTSLLAGGIIPGLGGILMFVPQIALLFAFIAILEDTGYMARVSFIMDRLMRGLGINGRSVIPLISGVACAVPAIMSTRTIKNYKERLITILITPLMSCSARLPVYTLLIAIAIPSYKVFGIADLRGLTMLGLYLIGFFAAVFSALLLRYWVKSDEKSYFIMELPIYRKPKATVVLQVVFDKLKVFVLDVGKVIIAIAIVLWFLSSFGPSNRIENAEDAINLAHMKGVIADDELENELNAARLKNSYAGILGHAIEPVIAPLGFDWKIGIALITSFAAREVFVGTMATIYNTGDPEEFSNLRDAMQQDINHRTGLPLFNLASAMALMLFYAFAMQCMSTIAVVKRETGSWKWPLIQFVYMGALAYLSAYAVYQILV
ncbi:MAG: ferrous iron transport protein B [Flavobacteriales bacterium]